MSFDELLPTREWVSLAEAATALACGRAENLDELTRRRIVKFKLYTRTFKRLARQAGRAALASEFEPDGQVQGVDALLTPEVRYDTDRLEALRAEYERFDKELVSTVRKLLRGGAEGSLRFMGQCEGEKRLDVVHPAELQDAKFEEVGLDRFTIEVNGTIWSDLNIERASLAAWAAGQERTLPVELPPPVTPLQLREIEDRFRDEVARRIDGPRWRVNGEDGQDTFLLELDPTLTRDLRRDIRGRCVPQEWRKAGAPAKGE